MTRRGSYFRLMSLQPLGSKFQIRQARRGQGWLVHASWSSGRTADIPGFATEAEADDWIRSKSRGVARGAADGQPGLAGSRTEERPGQAGLSRQAATAERAEGIMRQPDQAIRGEQSQGGDPDDRDEENQGHCGNMREKYDKSKK